MGQKTYLSRPCAFGQEQEEGSEEKYRGRQGGVIGVNVPPNMLW